VYNRKERLKKNYNKQG